MDINHLKPFLSEEMFTQVSEAVKGVANLTIIDTSEGAWLPKAKFDEERNVAKTLRTTIADLTKELNEAKEAGKDAAGLQAQVDTLKKDLADSQGKMTVLTRNYQIKDIIRASDVRDADVVMKLLDTSKVEEKDGKLTGVAEQLEALKKSSPYLFNEQQPSRAGFGGGKPDGTKPDNSNTEVNNIIRAAAGRAH
jgi:hypothetical protein